MRTCKQKSSIYTYFVFIIHRVPKSVHDSLIGMIMGTEVKSQGKMDRLNNYIIMVDAKYY
jgi:hypothetical protein